MESCLEDIKVLELTSGWSAGAVCGRLLSELGASVIKLESLKGDSLRNRPPIKAKDEGMTFQILSTNKKSIAVDLATSEGRTLLSDLTKQVDVLIEDRTIPSGKSIHLTFEELSALNPSLIYCIFSPFGQTGDLKDHVGNDFIVQAMSGVVTTTGYPEFLPHKAGPLFATHASSVMGGIAILSALNYSQDTGLGQEIDIAIYDAMLSYLYTFIPGYFASGKTSERLGNKHPMIAPWDTYKAKDGWVIVCMADDKQWHNFLKLIDRRELMESPRYKNNDMRTQKEIREEVDGIVAEWVADKTMAEVMDLLEKIKIPSGPINDIEQLLNDEQFLSREMVQEMEHPVTGRYVTSGSIFKMDHTSGRLFAPSPALGQHTRALLKELCAYDDRLITMLEDNSIVLTQEV